MHMDTIFPFSIHFGGLFALKQWIFSSLKHDTVPRVNTGLQIISRLAEWSIIILKMTELNAFEDFAYLNG